MRLLDYNAALAAYQGGTLAQCQIPDLEALLKDCRRHVDLPYMRDTIIAIESEIHKQQEKINEEHRRSSDQEKIDGIRQIDGRVTTIDNRLSTLEREASRPEFRTWGFWFGLTAILVALAALFRDFLGWS